MNISQTDVKPIIIIDKPLHITSMTVVRILRRILKSTGVKRIGYAGTLDPYATGVLIVGIGREGTRRLGGLTDKDKEYICEIDLLKNSLSGDMEKFLPAYQMERPDQIDIPAIGLIEHLIKEKFIGEIIQIPPTLSAIKINGNKACDLVRKNIKVEIPERTVEIYRIDILSYQFPILELRVNCSKGTYIRTLGQDIGKALGLWGTVRSLRRTRCGEYLIENALDLNKITIDDLIKIK